MKRIQLIEKMADSYLNREIDASSHYRILELRVATSDVRFYILGIRDLSINISAQTHNEILKYVRNINDNGISYDEIQHFHQRPPRSPYVLNLWNKY
jgi:hypothetical protein